MKKLLLLTALLLATFTGCFSDNKSATDSTKNGVIIEKNRVINKENDVVGYEITYKGVINTKEPAKIENGNTTVLYSKVEGYFPGDLIGNFSEGTNPEVIGVKKVSKEYIEETNNSKRDTGVTNQFVYLDTLPYVNENNQESSFSIRIKKLYNLKNLNFTVESLDSNYFKNKIEIIKQSEKYTIVTKKYADNGVSVIISPKDGQTFSLQDEEILQMKLTITPSSKYSMKSIVESKATDTINIKDLTYIQNEEISTASQSNTKTAPSTAFNVSLDAQLSPENVLGNFDKSAEGTDSVDMAAFINAYTTNTYNAAYDIATSSKDSTIKGKLGNYKNVYMYNLAKDKKLDIYDFVVLNYNLKNNDSIIGGNKDAEFVVLSDKKVVNIAKNENMKVIGYKKSTAGLQSIEAANISVIAIYRDGVKLNITNPGDVFGSTGIAIKDYGTGKYKVVAKVSQGIESYYTIASTEIEVINFNFEEENTTKFSINCNSIKIKNDSTTVDAIFVGIGNTTFSATTVTFAAVINNNKNVDINKNIKYYFYNEENTASVATYSVTNSLSTVLTGVNKPGKYKVYAKMEYDIEGDGIKDFYIKSDIYSIMLISPVTSVTVGTGDIADSSKVYILNKALDSDNYISTVSAITTMGGSYTTSSQGIALVKLKPFTGSNSYYLSKINSIYEYNYLEQLGKFTVSNIKGEDATSSTDSAVIIDKAISNTTESSISAFTNLKQNTGKVVIITRDIKDLKDDSGKIMSIPAGFYWVKEFDNVNKIQNLKINVGFEYKTDSNGIKIYTDIVPSTTQAQYIVTYVTN